MYQKGGLEHERETVDAVVEALQAHASIASVQRPIGGGSYILDAEVVVTIADRDVLLLVEVKKAVYTAR